MIYLDHAASTPVLPAALEVLQKSQKCDYANPSAAHKLGKNLHKKIDTARDFFLDIFESNKGNRKGQFLFTSSATESNNLVLNGLPLKAGDVAFVSFADHPSVTAPLQELEGHRGVKIIEIPLKEGGEIDQDSFISQLDEKTKLVVLTHVNNHSGNLYPIISISKEIKQKFKNIHIHLDAVQGFAKIKCNYSKGCFDTISISGHKVGGPKGIAGLYYKLPGNFKPILFGGGQEQGLRPSTLSAPLILSFAEAVREAFDCIDESYKKVNLVNQTFQKMLMANIDSIIFVCHEELSSPYILTFILPGVSSDIILRHMEREEIYLSSSSACSSRVRGENKVFSALKIPFKFHKFVLRVSFSSLSSIEECETFVTTLADNFAKLTRYQRR